MGKKKPTLLCSQASFFLQCVFQMGPFYKWSIGEICCSPGCVLKALFSPARAGHNNKRWSYHMLPFEGKVGCLVFLRAFSVYERWWTWKPDARYMPGRGPTRAMPIFQQHVGAPWENMWIPTCSNSLVEMILTFLPIPFWKDEAASAPASCSEGEHFWIQLLVTRGGKKACSYMALANTE